MFFVLPFFCCPLLPFLPYCPDNNIFFVQRMALQVMVVLMIFLCNVHQRKVLYSPGRARDANEAQHVAVRTFMVCFYFLSF